MSTSFAGVGSGRVDLFSETLRVAFTQQGAGRAFLLLHGGAGPASMKGLAGALAAKGRVLVPVHPGFDGEPRPAWFRGIDDLATAYLALVERLGMEQVVVVGNSVGGWIAAEMALRKSPRVAGIVLLDAMGIDAAPDRPLVDPAKVPVPELLKLSFHDPARFAVAPSGPEAIEARVQNQRTLRVYAGEPFMHDPTLRERLADATTPALVVWGESDRIADVAYGRRLAKSIPGARFEVVAEAGHFPQIEKLDETRRLVEGFAAGV